LAGELGMPAECVLVHTADATQEGPVNDLVAAVIARWGRVDVLLNCVGEWMGGKRVWETEAETWDMVMALNLRAAFLLSRAVLPSMLQNGWGRIVHISSRMALEPQSLSVAYTISKMGLIRLTETLASEIKGTGVTANVIVPSFIDTPDSRAAVPQVDFSRCVPAEAIAATMQFLCTDAARYVNGARIPMYGSV